MAQGRGEAKTSPRRVLASQRQTQAIQLRIAGHTYEHIAAQLGYAGRQGAYKAVTFGLNSQLNPAVDEMRSLERLRLDELQQAVWDEARGGNLQAFDRVMKVIQTRIRLEGLESQGSAPATQEEPTKIPLAVLDRVIREVDAMRGNAMPVRGRPL